MRAFFVLLLPVMEGSRIPVTEQGGDQVHYISDTRGSCFNVFFREFNNCGVDLSPVCLDLLAEIHVVGT